MPRPLQDIAALIRSKNAGPFVLTIDVLFSSSGDLDAVVEAGVLTGGTIASLYGCARDDVRLSVYRPGLAIKIAMPRGVPSGSAADADIYGAQQHGPVAELLV